MDTSDTGNPYAQISSSGDSPNLLGAITLLQKALAVHGTGGSGQADTTVILSEPDTNTGSTYDKYLRDLEKCEERGPPLSENIAKLFQNLVCNDINVKKLENLLKEVLPPEI